MIMSAFSRRSMRYGDFNEFRLRCKNKTLLKCPVTNIVNAHSSVNLMSGCFECRNMQVFFRVDCTSHSERLIMEELPS